jgi:RNA polymerase sigma-70 factor (ECF subfamily)
VEAPDDPRSDEELLEAAARDPDAFGLFYQRNLVDVVRFFMHRVRDPELAADLTSEVFAAAFLTAKRYRRGEASARTWLYAVARHKLLDSARRGRVEASARRKLGIPRLALEDDDIERIQEMAGSPLPDGEVLGLLADLPDDVGKALSARVIDDRDYPKIAREMKVSEAPSASACRAGCRGCVRDCRRTANELRLLRALPVRARRGGAQAPQAPPPSAGRRRLGRGWGSGGGRDRDDRR